MPFQLVHGIRMISYYYEYIKNLSHNNSLDSQTTAH